MKIDGRGGISPEMLKANIDDVVAWTFDQHKQNDVHLLSKDGCSVSYTVKKAKKGGTKYDINEGFELDAKTLAGEAMKPRSVLWEFQAVAACEFYTKNFDTKTHTDL